MEVSANGGREQVAALRPARLRSAALAASGWEARQVGCASAFAQAELDEEACAELPAGFDEPNQAGACALLRIKRREATLQRKRKLSAGLRQRGLTQPKADPPHPFLKGMICVICANGAAFAGARRASR